MAVVDAVAELKTGFHDTIGEWLDCEPDAFADPQSFQKWAAQYPVLFKTGKALDVDCSKVAIAHFTGKVPATSGMKGPGVKRVTRSRRAATRRNGGSAVTTEQVMTFLRTHPATTAKAIATELGASYDTVMRRIKDLEGEGRIRREGERADTRWFVRQPAAA